MQLCGRKSQSVRSYSLDPLADGTSSAAPLKTAKDSIESADSRSLRSFAPAVPMIKAVQPGPGDYCGSRRKPAVNGPSVQGVLMQGIVNPILVVVVHVIANEPPQMSFVQSDDMVEHLAAAASHPALCDPICQGA